jgi:hypothetical protein
MQRIMITYIPALFADTIGFGIVRFNVLSESADPAHVVLFETLGAIVEHSEAAALTSIEASSTVGRSASLHWVNRSATSEQLDRGLAAGCAWLVRTLTGCSVWAARAVVGATSCGVCWLSFVKPLIA